MAEAVEVREKTKRIYLFICQGSSPRRVRGNRGDLRLGPPRRTVSLATYWISDVRLDYLDGFRARRAHAGGGSHD